MLIERNTFIIIGCTLTMVILGVNLYFNWRCNKDTDGNEKVLGMNFKKFRNNLNIFSAIVILIMWICCIILFTSKKICMCSEAHTQVQAQAQVQALEPMQTTTTSEYNP
jgi:flagellar basal body-associated protein FliL